MAVAAKLGGKDLVVAADREHLGGPVSALSCVVWPLLGGRVVLLHGDPRKGVGGHLVAHPLLSLIFGDKPNDGLVLALCDRCGVSLQGEELDLASEVATLVGFLGDLRADGAGEVEIIDS